MGRPDERERPFVARLEIPSLSLSSLVVDGVDDATLRRAVVMGSTLASFCVEAFSLDRLLKLTRAEIDARYRLFKKLTDFEAL